MKRMVFSGLALLALLVAPAVALASNTVLSGVFDGTDPKADPMPGSCGGSRQLVYQDVGTFQVSADGNYLVTDAFNLNGADVTALIYDGVFNPANPTANAVTPDGVDTVAIVNLSGGVSYRLVVQQWCSNDEGAWAVTFSGPGNVTSPNVRDVPAMTEGLFSNSDPTATTDCASAAQYHQTGPVNVAASGRYYYTDILIETDADVCVQVYTEPFNPNDPDANRVALMDDFATVELEAGQDYYFVAQPFAQATTGEYFFVLAPPAPFRINKALAGGWFNPQTNGQGVFIDVYDNSNQMFVGWYTFDLSRPVDGTAQLGEPGHRWLTALGPIDGAEGSLDVYLARGGAFDSVNPPIESPQTVVGSMSVEFTDCLAGTINYNLTTPVVSGEIPIIPLAGDHVELCQSIVNVPGMPGPL